MDKVQKIREWVKARLNENNSKQSIPQFYGMMEEDARFLDFLDTMQEEPVELEEVGVWKTVDNINTPQADRNKIYCVFTKDRYILATVINHPKDEELLQWKCTEFPFHRYDMCEGDKYMQIV